MGRFTRLFLLSMISAATVVPPAVRAAVVAISHDRLEQCGHANVVCDGAQPFSLSALESGMVQLPITSNEAQDFVIVNDTGAAVRVLQFSFFGQLSSNTDLTCHLQADALQLFHSCTVVGTASEGNGTSTLRGLIDPPAEFTFVADSSQSGIPEGAFFDITVSGFSHGGADRGYLTGTGTSTGTDPGTGTGGNGGNGGNGGGAPLK